MPVIKNKIVFEGIDKVYGDINALQNIDLKISEGRTTVLIGPSGCGKSTILRLINGLLLPTAGTVQIDGQPLQSLDTLELRRRMGYVIQDGGLFPHLSAADNAALMARELKWSPSAISSRLTALCTLTHFPKSGLERYPFELSGGQRQRVGLMRALFLEPHILLLDEPLGALDPMVRSRLQTDLKEIFTRLEITVVCVTHDMGEAAYFGDHIVLLQAGKVVQQGSLDDLRQRPAGPFVSEFMEAQRSLINL